MHVRGELSHPVRLVAGFTNGNGGRFRPLPQANARAVLYRTVILAAAKLRRFNLTSSLFDSHYSRVTTSLICFLPKTD